MVHLCPVIWGDFNPAIFAKKGPKIDMEEKEMGDRFFLTHEYLLISLQTCV